MKKTIDATGSVLGVAGILICLLAGLMRVMGSHYLLGFESITLFTGGISIMVAGCLAKLHSLSMPGSA